MSEENNDTIFLSLKDIVKESLIRDIILFSFLFILVISQVWETIILLLFPLITFAFSLFFRIISTNKWRTEFENSLIIYNPFGLEKKHANRLFFCAIFQLIIIFWLGAESLYNSHLIEGYFIYFNLLFGFLYTFGFFWIFIDQWKYSRIEIITGEEKHNFDGIISFLKLQNFRYIALFNISIFISLNLVNLLFILFINQNLVTGIPLSLPGNSIISSSIIFVMLFTSPVIAIISLILSYKDVNNINRDQLDKVLRPLPTDIRINIIENLKTLNKKIKSQLNIE
ncbi:MAG: hypothetical protein ACXAEX_12055 [Promethearchaeota archaeon]|jgi:hypothetical protein